MKRKQQIVKTLLSQVTISSIIALVTVIGIFAVFGAMLFDRTVGEQVKLILVGSLSGTLTTIVGFYFGSSHNNPNNRSPK